MSAHLLFEQLCDYWAGELDVDAEERVEAHTMGCEACAQRSSGLLALTEALRMLSPPVIDAAALAKFSARGLRVLENSMQPGERRSVRFPADVDLMVHRLGGLALADVSQVDFRMRVEETGAVLVVLEAAPFDVATGSVMLLCQQHYATLPPNVVSELELHHANGSVTRTEYTIRHQFERA